MEVKNSTLSLIRGMRKCGSGVEFDVVVVERRGPELREYTTTLCTDGKFVTSYMAEFGKIERIIMPYPLPEEEAAHTTAH
ncbi:MAG: hypothetical protein HYR55_03450 [Acidobacteria bacterium]|nr:hypothetical protein [Acidobacteriota bacterium]MBI3655644.1 hypothetical protein [Acidobacteriota bacterium]